MNTFLKTTVIVLGLGLISAHVNATAPYVRVGISDCQGDRESMEDAHTIARNKGTQAPNAFFALYDGHGGDQASAYAATHLQNFFFAHRNRGMSIPDSLINAFHQTDTAIQSSLGAGTTAVIAYIEGATAYIAWTGDSRALIIRNNHLLLHTQDHKPDSPAERARIEAAGGSVLLVRGEPRINGLPMSRALGDKNFKRPTPGAIIATPEILQFQLQRGDVIILGCDGVWDTVDNNEAAQLVADLKSPSNGARRYSWQRTGGRPIPNANRSSGGDPDMLRLTRALRNEAYARGSGDNISVMAIEYIQAPPAKIIPKKAVALIKKAAVAKKPAPYKKAMKKAVPPKKIVKKVVRKKVIAKRQRPKKRRHHANRKRLMTKK